ncbi:uncharacterized protein LOC126689298 isoform X2 [Quercus robur]|uniref:uncharacterized protein LOC126689298 isoform X2 n=1 Tax=Quercus robur TaxID=38942 RepID=UPI0021635C08|nr:uncharacterized protein LOC126689298 isoform X2 [Quercus robur]
MLNLEEREEREGKRKVASDNELNFRSKSSMLRKNLTICAAFLFSRFSSEYFSQPPLTVTLSRTWRKEKREKGEGSGKTYTVIPKVQPMPLE